MAKKTLEQFRDDIAIVFKRGKAKVPRKSATERFKRTHTHSHATTNNYARIADAFARFVYEQHGVTDLRFVSSAHGREYMEHCFSRFQSGELAAGTAKTYVHALSKLQNLAREQMGTRIRIINKD